MNNICGGISMIWNAFEFASDRVSKKGTIEQILCFITAATISFIMAINFFYTIDRVPATIDDFIPLNEKLLSVENNPDVILIGDGTIIIEGDKISYTIENDECKMIGNYNLE
jgi:hypothetical protein